MSELLEQNGYVGGHYVEPYAGGAGVAMALLLAKRVCHVHLNDSSLPIYALWKCVVSHPEELCRAIARASLSVEEWRKRRAIVHAPEGYGELDVGFSALYLNRCNRSGVLSGGLIGGLAQAGQWRMDARFPRNELIRRIEAIAQHSEAITVRNTDAEQFLLEYVPDLPAQTLVYCDPPYFGQASRLYLNRYTREDHARIAGLVQTQLKHRWVVSYDNAREIAEYYQGRRMFAYSLHYNAARVYEGQELLIFSDDLVVPSRSAVRCVDRAVRACGALQET
jgi:DNA adenine methylase